MIQTVEGSTREERLYGATFRALRHVADKGPLDWISTARGTIMAMNEAERTSLLELVGGGDRDAMQRLIISYHAALRGKIEADIEPSLRALVDADDVLQEAYVSAFGATAECSFDSPAAFYKWLERIAVNRLKDRRRGLRTRKRDVARLAADRATATTSYPDLVERLVSPESTPSRKLARREMAAALVSSLARLTEDQRRVVKMRFLEGLSVADVARAIGKTEPAVHMLCHRGLKELRELMGSITRYMSRH